MTTMSSTARDTTPVPKNSPKHEPSSVDDDTVFQEEENCPCWQLLTIIGAVVLLVPLLIVVVCCCCVSNGGSSDAGVSPGGSDAEEPSGPSQPPPSPHDVSMSTRVRCDAESINKTAGDPKKIIWTFWHEKKAPLRLQQLIEGWKAKAPEWQVLLRVYGTTYLWDNVGDVHLLPKSSPSHLLHLPHYLSL